MFHSFHEKSCIMGFMRAVPEGASRIFKVELFRSKYAVQLFDTLVEVNTFWVSFSLKKLAISLH
jgi:hypothetical protein